MCSVSGKSEENTVKDNFGALICEGMYVIETCGIRQGWVVAVKDGNIKVKIIREGEKCLTKSYLTDFEQSKKWCVGLN